MLQQFSSTVTKNSHLDVFPQLSVAIIETAASPSVNWYPDGTELVIEAIPQLSVAIGFDQLTLAVQSASDWTVIFGGQKVILGGMVSLI